MEIATGTRGTNYDGVNIGTSQLLTYGGTLTLTMVGAVVPDTYNLFSFTSGSNTGNFSNVLFAGGYYTGAFSRLGSVWTAVSDQGQTFTFDQATGALVAPEPSTWALLGVALAVVVLFRHRRNLGRHCNANCPGARRLKIASVKTALQSVISYESTYPYFFDALVSFLLEATRDGIWRKLFHLDETEEASHENWSPDGTFITSHGWSKSESWVQAHSWDGACLWREPMSGIHIVHATCLNNARSFAVDDSDG